MKCLKCGKSLKENTDGDLKYCQGHWIGEKVAKKQDKREAKGGKKE